jgi:5-methylthioadenosine/S-adenosylhomocysteine deaminase
VTEVYAADWVLPVEGAPIEGGGVAVEGGRIVAVGPVADLPGEVHRFEDAAIVPGFVNAHTHLEYAVYAGFGDGLPFGPWLALHIERKRRLEWDDVVAVARLGAAECLASGITTVGDSSFTGAAAVAAAELGLRATVYLEVFGATSDEISTRFEANRQRAAAAFSGLVRLGISPHAPYTCSAELYAACLELGLPLATHLAESDDETQWMTAGGGAWQAYRDELPPPPGVTGVRHLARHGLLTSRMVAAHCVKADAEEIDLLAEHDVAVVHCPRSNAYLGCGIAPLRDLLAASIRVGLGTDSPASTPSFDMFDEMRAAVAFARARGGDAGALPAGEALRLATLGSAEALGIDRDVGSLVPGKHADLAIVSLAGSRYLPWEDPESAVVFGGTPERVCRTIVGGVTRYAGGGFEWQELRQNAASARGRMLGLESGRRSG